MEPLVSIIIPVYNVKPYLHECVDSVIAQTYQNIEIILVDDGSTDGSEGICNEYVFARSHVQIIHKKNGGQSSARNLGFEIATGKYIYCLDSDDYLTFNAIEKLVDAAENNTAELVFFDAHCFLDGQDKEIKQSYHRANQYKMANGLETFTSLMTNKEYFISPCLVFLTRKLINDYRIRFAEGIIYEDMLYTFMIFCRAKKTCGVAESLYERRYRTASTMTQKKTLFSFFSTVEVYKKVVSFVDEEKLTNNDAVKAYVCRCAYAVFNCYRDLTRIERRTVFQEYQDFKKELNNRECFQNRALAARCIGYYPWAIVRVLQKVF